MASRLNTVTLAALIVTLGMIVDNSIVIIDAYLENRRRGISLARSHSQCTSSGSLSSQLRWPSVSRLCLSYSTKGMMNDAVVSLGHQPHLHSLLVAVLLVPFACSIILYEKD
ncbi:MAG: hypothetical protein R2738_04065 [Bacteroides graminisolvens]